MNKIKRPLAVMVIWLIIGIIGGEVYLKEVRLLPLFLIGTIAAARIYNIIFGYQAAAAGLGVLLLGIFCTINHPVIQERLYFKEDDILTFCGSVQNIKTGEFNQTLTISHVQINYKNKIKSIHSRVNVNITNKNDIKLYDTLKVTGSVLPASHKMNPSDMNYEKYLMGQGIIASIKVNSYEILHSNKFHKDKLLGYADRQIERIFRNKDQGIIRTLLLGDDDEIPEEVYEIYSKTGIAHVLSISGFHIALMITLLAFLFGYTGIPYTARYLSIAACIWAYAYITGLSTATTRACIMATLVIIARCIWEEEDLPTNLALAAGIILLINPFQLYSVGFQLSFVAVGSLLISSSILSVLETATRKQYHKTMRNLIPWICVTLGTYPILAFHFFEIPFLCTLLNLLLIPIFSLIIIISWISLIVGIASLSAGIFIAEIIIFLLNGIIFIGDKMLHMPLGTLCVGRPSYLVLCICYVMMGGLWLAIIGKIKKEVCMGLFAIVLTGCMLGEIMKDKVFEITYLYVGQGDGIVMMTPHHRTIIIDGGNFGKGKTLEKYIKFRGQKTIEAIILSHSDADHIGGIIDLLDEEIKVKHLFVSKSDDTVLIEQLMKKCMQKHVKVFRVGYGDILAIDNIRITCLTPQSTVKEEDNNNNSIGCVVQYKQFSALFTGDMDKTKEAQMCETLQRVTVLKVSHHGSRTGMSNEVLLKTRPQYAIISCGIHNRYNHPHLETLETLRKYPIDVLRTDINGAVMLKTNGKNVFVSSQLKGNR